MEEGGGMHGAWKDAWKNKKQRWEGADQVLEMPQGSAGRSKLPLAHGD